MKLILKSFVVFITAVIAVNYFGSLFQAFESQNKTIILATLNLGIGGLVVALLFTSFILLSRMKD